MSIVENQGVKAYHLWPGKHFFICGGRVMLGSAIKKPLITIIALLVSEGLYLYTPIKYSTNFVYEVSISILLWFASIFLGIIVGISDPGYIPKQSPPFAKGPKVMTLEKLVQSNENFCATSLGQIEIPFNGCILRLKYCSSCLILRPPRASHCNDCGMCVEKYDHHCPWLGICIGKRNYRNFVGFLTVSSIAHAFNLVSSVWVLRRLMETRGGNGTEILENSGVMIFHLGFEGIVRVIQIFLFFIGLCIFHWRLILKSETTREFRKNAWRIWHPFKADSVMAEVAKFCSPRHILCHFDKLKVISLDFDNYNINPSSEAIVHSHFNNQTFQQTIEHEITMQSHIKFPSKIEPSL